MGHHHEHHHGSKNIRVAFFLNFVFTIIEIAGGLFTNSIAILSDALHDLGDTLSLGIAWYFEKKSLKGRQGVYSYGYRRFSLLGALINALILVIGSVFILSEAVPRIINPQPSNAEGMILLAFLGVIFNGAAVLKLGSKNSSINQKVVRLHLLEDIFGWLAVLIGAVIMYFFNLPIIDPILSVLISVFVMWNAVKNLKSTLQIILQGMPEKDKVVAVEKYLKQLDVISNYHDFHLWSMDGEYHIMTVHIVPANETSLEHLEALKGLIKTDLKGHGINHVTIEFDLKKENCELIDC